MPTKTLADTLAARETIYVNCGHPMCCKSTKLDVQALKDRLGPGHGSMHEDLVGLFACSKCKAEGRDRRPVFFTCIPDYEGLNAKGRVPRRRSGRKVLIGPRFSGGERGLFNYLGQEMIEKPATTYVVSVFEKPHWRTILTTGDKAEAEALEQAMVQDGVKARRRSRRG